MGSSCRFGPFRVDRAAYAVTRDGRPVTLTPKLLDLLIYFLDRPARLITKEELLDAVWPGANVTENALAQAVSELRQALGDAAGDPRFIRTIARRGYRFIAAVERADEPPASPGNGPAVPADPVAGAGLGARETASLDAHRALVEGSLRLESLDVRELEPARRDFERAVSLDPRYAHAYAGLSSAEFALYETTRCDNEPAQHQLDRAIEHARHAVALDERLAEAHAALSLALVSAWRTVDAVAAAQRAVALDPSNWRHLFRLGHASWGDARLKAASRTLSLYPEFAFGHFETAMVHVARGHLARAEAVLHEGVSIQQRQAGQLARFPALGLHWLLGAIRLAQEDAAGAREEFDRELRLADPHRLYGREYAMHAHYGRGAAWLREGRADEAVDAFASALALYPDYAASRLGMAQALRRRGEKGSADVEVARVEEALATLTRSRPIEAALVRSMLLADRDRLDEAVRGLEMVLADAPPGFAGWTLPIEPWLRPLHVHAAYGGVLRRLADRAG